MEPEVAKQFIVRVTTVAVLVGAGFTAANHLGRWMRSKPLAQNPIQQPMKDVGDLAKNPGAALPQLGPEHLPPQAQASIEKIRKIYQPLGQPGAFEDDLPAPVTVASSSRPSIIGSTAMSAPSYVQPSAQPVYLPQQVVVLPQIDLPRDFPAPPGTDLSPSIPKIWGTL